MMFQGKNIFNASFDVFANNYHAVRPGYPMLLFEDIKDRCELNNSSQLLEIGAGSGIATVELAKIGCRVVAIEPGANLASIAKEQVEKFHNVEIFEGTFEKYSTSDKFDAALAFTAFHWLKGEEKYQQTFDLLNDSGSLVLIWNSFFQDDSAVTEEVNKAYLELLPDIYPEKAIVEEVNKGVLSKLNNREKEIISNTLFYPVFLKKYITIYNYDDETYPKLLNTFPKIIEVDDVRRNNFLERISKIVGKYGRISMPVLTTLVICKKRNHFLEVMRSSNGGLNHDKH